MHGRTAIDAMHINASKLRRCTDLCTVAYINASPNSDRRVCSPRFRHEASRPLNSRADVTLEPFICKCRELDFAAMNRSVTVAIQFCDLENLTVGMISQTG
ncbi:hypothetical protein EVAR_21109_1 [Eumeta japonica]|uniref:Uncharacterized protein n=1 Tax=Eumeta variegata TaxID=151549 RepID=A0A4C1VWA9_EUMVA|nr:hypothetical protein EVAR_21109_1 [Eumeta japonica]